MPAVGSPILLHLHLPKTGGQTLVQLLYHFYASKRSFHAEGGFLRDGIYYYPRGIEDDDYPPNMNAPNAVDPPDQVTVALRRPDVHAVSGHFAFGLHRVLDRDYRYITVVSCSGFGGHRDWPENRPRRCSNEFEATAIRSRVQEAGSSSGERRGAEFEPSGSRPWYWSGAASSLEEGLRGGRRACVSGRGSLS